MVNATFPAAFQCLFRPARYKVLYGGRAGGKSWAVARALLLKGLNTPIRVLCAREYQNSIKDSVHKVLSDQIESMGLGAFYEIQQANIKGPNGTEFSFEGIKHNVARVKSYEGIDICWVEEANLISKNSWEVLIPTIRKPDSEIWITFNPELDTDETYVRFIKNTPVGAVTQYVSWRDNPFFPQVLLAEMEELKARDKDAYLNIWEGHCRQVLDGAVYADELRDSQAEGRILKVPYDHTKPVYTFWDLGFSDYTSIWFAQIVGYDYRIIDYYQNNLKKIDHYLTILQERGYIYDADWLPHDAKAKSLGTGMSIEELLRAKGRKVRITPRLSLTDGINAARTIFANCYFDMEKCAEGIQCLRHYRYDTEPGTNTLSKTPLHDWASHGADAFRYLAIGLREPKAKGGLDHFLQKLKKKSRIDYDNLDYSPVGAKSDRWMG